MLELVEKLLASLIILAMLVLVLFLAIPEIRKTAQPEPPRQEQAPAQRAEKTPPPDNSASPRTEPKQQASKEPAKPLEPETQPVTPATQPKQQNPFTYEHPPERRALAPAAPEAGGSQVVQTQEQPKSQMRLPPQVAEKAAPVESGKGAMLRAKVRPETIITRRPMLATRNDGYRRGQDDEYEYRSRQYARNAQYRSRWDRTDYYECAGGQCECNCENRPYWARPSPMCPD